VRLDIAPMVANRVLATTVEDFVRRMEFVTDARASAISGSLLVTYDPRRGPVDLPVRMQAEIQEWLAGARSSGGSFAGARRGALSRILKVSRQRRGEGLGPVLLSVGGYVLTTLQGLTSAAILDVAKGGRPVGGLSRFGLMTTRSQLKALTAAALLLTSAELWTSYARNTAWRRFSQRAEHRLRTEVWTQILRQDMAFFDEHGTGQLMAFLTGDVASIGALIEQADGIIQSSLTILAGGALLLRAAPGLATLAGVSVVLMLIPVRLLRPRSRQVFAQKAEVGAGLSQRLENVLSGIVEVKSFTAEDVEARRFRKVSQALAQTSSRANVLAQLQTALAGHLFFGGYTLALSYGARRLLSGKMDEDLFNRVTFWYPRLVVGLGRIQGSTDVYLGARAAAEHLTEVLASEPRIRDGATRRDPSTIRGDIVVENVSFGYDPSVPILRNVSFHLPAGETLGIVGQSGSGKTTLLRLLLRFHDPDSGRILLDGVDLKDLRVKDLRAAIALVSQDIYLFDGSLGHNVRYGQPGATDDAVVAAIAAAGARDLLDVLPEGIATEVGERGYRLSGGQRQRLAIARALLKNAPVLTLDEATSHLDYITEAAVTTSTPTSGKTVIVSTHRLVGVRDADNIIVLDGGTILEQGRHQDLLDQRRLYYDLWHMQNGR
jgi:ATP-binding cassette subfamily B protein